MEQRIFEIVLAINRDIYLTGISYFLGIGLPEFDMKLALLEANLANDIPIPRLNQTLLLED